MLQVTWNTWKDERVSPRFIGGLLSLGGLLGLAAFRLREKWMSKPSFVSSISPQDEASFKEGVEKFKLAVAMLETVVTTGFQLSPLVRHTEEDAKGDADARLLMGDAKPHVSAAKIIALVRSILEELANKNYPYVPPRKP